MAPNPNIQILLVEDNPGDVDLTRENLNHSKILHELHVANTGEECVAFLRTGDVAIDLILLDLNLPGQGGLSVLEEIKGDPGLRTIPVVVLTSSSSDSDIARSYDLHASAYVTKPVDLKGFGQIVTAIEDFWFEVVRYPEARKTP